MRGNVFAIEDSLRQVIEELPAAGSGPYGLRNNAVLEGSERVEVVVRDRNQPSRIVSVRPLGRLVDYSFEPFSGRILLNSFLPSFDSDLNPVSLRITYELDQGTEKFLVVGAEKADAVLASWQGDAEVPAGVARGTDETIWFVDADAAAELPYHVCEL